MSAANAPVQRQRPGTLLRRTSIPGIYVRLLHTGRLLVAVDLFILKDQVGFRRGWVEAFV
jgi:hypothetical protein